jgi:hypothetical protein
MKVNNKLFLVALHARSFDQCMVEAKGLLTQDGAHGVIIGNRHSHISSRTADGSMDLFNIAIEVKKKYPDYVVGINPTGMKNYDAIYKMKDLPLDILWVDDGGINQSGEIIALNYKVAKDLEFFDFSKQKYFGSLDSKLLAVPPKISFASKLAFEKFGVVTVNGLTVGQTPSIFTIKIMREALPEDGIIAVSDVNITNACQFLRYADIIISNESLLANKNDPFVYDTDKVKALRAEFDRCEKELLA